MNSLTNRFKKLKNRKGFTLVELIVVIVIVGILAAILIPRLTGFTDKANETQALVWAKEVATAVDSYYAEHNDWPAEADVDDLHGITESSSCAISINATGGGLTVRYTKGSDSWTAGRDTVNDPIAIQ